MIADAPARFEPNVQKEDKNFGVSYWWQQQISFKQLVNHVLRVVLHVMTDYLKSVH